MTCECIMLLVGRIEKIDTGRISIFIIHLVKILTYFRERHYLMSNEYTNQSMRHLRRTHHYPKDAYSSYSTWRSANYPARNACSWEHHFPSRKNRTGWMRRSYRLKFREMVLVCNPRVQPVRVAATKRTDIRPAITSLAFLWIDYPRKTVH